MAVYVDDRYLNSQDSEFVNLIISDIQKFLDSVEDKADQVLLFPPVSSYHRFLIHKTVEDFPVLCSFSIGEGDDRRSVVCLQELVLRKILSADAGISNPESKGEESVKAEEKHDFVSEDGVKNSGSSVISDTVTEEPDVSVTDMHTCEPESESSKLDSVDSVPVVKESSQPSCETVDAEKAVNDNSETDSGETTMSHSNPEEQSTVPVSSSHVECSNSSMLSSASEPHDGENRTDAGVSNASAVQSTDIQSDGSPATASEESVLSPLDDVDNKVSMESADDVQCDLSPALMKELSVAVGAVHIARPVVEYWSYLCREADSRSEEDYGRLIEIYDFPEGMITRDLLVLFREFRDKFFDIKWVDRTHAIGIFSSQEIAEYVISNFDHPLAKVCPLHLASPQTRQAARKSREILEPNKPRPETTTTTARNLVHGALGIRRPSSKEHSSSKEHAREHKRHSRKSDDHHSSSRSKRRVWDGKIRPCAMDME